MSGTVTVSWIPSPDEKKDDRLHYMITKRDSVKRSWQTVADHLFNNKFTLINIMPGRQYYFRIYAKNDMGVSKPSESQAWEVKKRKGMFNAKASKHCFLKIEMKDIIFEETSHVSLYLAYFSYIFFVFVINKIFDMSPRIDLQLNKIKNTVTSHAFITCICKQR